MLRFARVKDEVQLHLVKKEQTPYFLQGLGLALAFHLLFIFIFHVVSPAPPEESILLTPSSVEIDLGQKRITQTPPPSPPFEKAHAPALYELAPSVVCGIDSYTEFSCSQPDFSEVEKMEYEPVEVDFDHS